MNGKGFKSREPKSVTKDTQEKGFTELHRKWQEQWHKGVQCEGKYFEGD